MLAWLAMDALAEASAPAPCSAPTIANVLLTTQQICRDAGVPTLGEVMTIDNVARLHSGRWAGLVVDVPTLKLAEGPGEGSKARSERSPSVAGDSLFGPRSQRRRYVDPSPGRCATTLSRKGRGLLDCVLILF